MADYDHWCSALEAALAEPFPAEYVEQKRKGGNAISFVAWHHYARRLNRLVGGGWSVGPLTFHPVGDKLLTALPLTILGVTRTNVGTEDEDKDDFGDAATNSWAQAFKRSCALFSMGLDMYDKKGVTRHEKPVPPAPKVADKSSIDMIVELTRTRVVDDETSDKIGAKIVEGMSIDEALKTIRYLQKQPKRETVNVT